MLGGGCRLVLLCLVAAVVMGAMPSHAQPDSVRAEILREKGFSTDHSPRGALWRAAAVPGWGQFYNRQYVKIPFVYAGLAGGVFAVFEMNDRYILFRHAHLYKIGESESGGMNEYQYFEDDYQEVVRRVGGDLGASQLRNTRDKYRRWRDLSIIGTGLFYALTIVDAYVSAHLLVFSVGDDLALDVRPVGAGATVRTDTQPAGPVPRVDAGAGVRVRLRF